MIYAVTAPFTTPGLQIYDGLRVFCVVGGTIVLVAMIVQFLAVQPGLSPRIQRARGAFIIGTFLLLVADVNVEIERFGKPPLMLRLTASTLGVVVLLLWLVFEQQARRYDPRDRLRRMCEDPDRPDQ